MCPDGHVIPLGGYESRAREAASYGERLTRMEHDHAAWLRFCEAYDIVESVIGDLEGRHMGEDGIDDARGHLDELKSTMTGIVGDVVRWAGVR